MQTKIYTLPELQFVGGASQTLKFHLKRSNAVFDAVGCAVNFSIMYHTDRYSSTVVLSKTCTLVQDSSNLYSIVEVGLLPQDTKSLFGEYDYQIALIDINQNATIPNRGIIHIVKNINEAYITNAPDYTGSEYESITTTIMTRLDNIEVDISDFSSTTSGKGASLVGINDAGNLINATTVEGALQEHSTQINALDAEVETLNVDVANLKTRISYDDDLIMGVQWDRQSNPNMIRIDGSFGMVANIGKDGDIVRNDFDKAPIYREIGEVTDAYGNVFIRIPKFYIQRKQGDGFQKTRITKTKYTDFYLPWCFWDFTNNKELDYIDIGKYNSSLSVDSKLESKPDKYPLINKTIVDFRTYAKANNNTGIGLLGYQQMDIHVHDIISALFEVEFATLNSQSIMQGYTAGQYTSTHLATVAETVTNRIIVANATADLYRVGQTISVGTSQGGNQIFYGRTITAIAVYDASNKAITFDGNPVDIAVGNYLYNTGWKNGFSCDIAASSGYITANDGKYPCMYRGIENPWGNVWQFCDGININDWQSWVCKNADNYASNVFASPYDQLSYVNANANGYAKYMGYDASYPFAQIPIDVSGSSSTYYADYYYQSSGQRVALFGSHWYGGSSAGLWYWDLGDSSSVAAVNDGGRLVKKAL